MKHLLIILTSFLFLISCAEDKELGAVEIDTALDFPLTFLAPRTLTVGSGDNASQITLDPPHSLINLTFSNKSSRAVTIVSVIFRITDPLSGEISISNLSDFVQGDQTFFVAVKAEGDVNCDGIVNEDDNGATPPALCDLADGEGRTLLKAYVDGMAANSQSADPDNSLLISERYRGASFPVEAIFEGWFGGPNDPQANFYKKIFFVTRAN